MEGSLLYNLADFFTLHIPITLLILYTLQISIPCIVLTLYIAYSLYLAYFYTYHIPLPSIFLYLAYFYTLHIPITLYIPITLLILYTLHISVSCISLTLYIADSLYLAYFYTQHIPYTVNCIFIIPGIFLYLPYSFTQHIPLPSIFLYLAYFYTLHIHIPCIFVYLSYLFTLHISRSWCSRLEAERMPSRELLEVITYNITCKDQYFVGGMQCIYAACTIVHCTLAQYNRENKFKQNTTHLKNA